MEGFFPMMGMAVILLTMYPDALASQAKTHPRYAAWIPWTRALRDLVASVTLLFSGAFILSGALVQHDRGGTPEAQVWAMSLGLLAGGGSWLLIGWRRFRRFRERDGPNKV